MRHLRQHLYGLWGSYYPLPGLFFVVYSAIMFAIGDLRPEHVGATIFVAVLAYFGPRTKQFLVDISPYLVVAVGYDSVRYARKALVSADRVIGCSLQNADRTLFPAGTGVSLQEWLASHHTPALDLFFAGPYAVFAYVALLYAAYLYFVDRARMRFFLWSFAIANYISFLLWLVVPAAPPWYVHLHGCSIDLAVLPSAAGLERVDAQLGISYFHTFYSRAASVFGAMPSMHNAYPVLGLLTAWSATTWKTRPVHLFYLSWMFTASLYLDHHWIVDAIAGWLTAGIAVVIAARLLRAAREASGEIGAQPAGAE